MPIGIPIINTPTIKTINSSIGPIPNTAHLCFGFYAIPKPANVCRNRAAMRVFPFPDSLTSPLRFTAWFCDTQVSA
jgi:hypothetical protein